MYHRSFVPLNILALTDSSLQAFISKAKESRPPYYRWLAQSYQRHVARLRTRRPSLLAVRVAFSQARARAARASPPSCFHERVTVRARGSCNAPLAPEEEDQRV